MNDNPLVLLYDIETCLSLASIFGLGKQVVRHNSLLGGYFDRTHIMTISYKFVGSDETVCLHWGDSIEDEKAMLVEFQEQVKKADIVLGKNNKRFDDKHIMANNMWFDLDGMSDMVLKSEDLESQLRKYFKLQSYSLDYISSQLGYGGKDKMSFEDWRDLLFYRMLQLGGSNDLLPVLTGRSIKEIRTLGKLALDKMITYNIKDVDDTEAVWNYCFKHFSTTKVNRSAALGHLACKECGSTDVTKNGTRTSGKTLYHHFFCKDHGGYAGKTTKDKKGNFGVLN